MACSLNGFWLAAWPWARVKVTTAPAWPQLAARLASTWQVSTYGRIKRPNGSLTWGSKHGAGYQKIMIQRKQWLVHRLVLHVFRGPPRDQLAWQVNHLDGNRENNRLDNLEWVTGKQNVRHALNSFPRNCSGAKHSMPVSCRAWASSCWTAYSSKTAAAKALGISRWSVSKSCSQGTVVKGHGCQLLSPKEFVIEGEQWKAMFDPKTGCPLPGRTVSSLGRLKNKTGRIFTGHRRKDGYCVTSIRLNSEPRHRQVLIHQLVARAFLGLPPSPQHTQVNHKDGNRNNNTVQNLEYATPAENTAHSYRLTPTRTYSNVKPIESRPFGSSDQWRRHSSVTGAAKELGVQRQNIHQCLKGCHRQTGGYEFRNAPSSPHLCGEQWRAIDLAGLVAERSMRTS